MGSSSSLFNVALSIWLSVIEDLYRKAHEYGNLANRTIPAAKDLVKAIEDFGMQPADLKPSKSLQRKRKRGTFQGVQFDRGNSHSAEPVSKISVEIEAAPS